MTSSAPMLPLLVFEAAECLMAVPASEIAQLENRRQVQFSRDAENGTGPSFVDLGDYFLGRESDGPWLQWARGTRSLWLGVRRVIDVVPVALSVLTPMPAIFKARPQSQMFLAAGLRGDDVFLLLDPARLSTDSVSGSDLEVGSGVNRTIGQ